MKNLLLLSLALLISSTSFADIGALESVELSSDLVSVSIEDNDESLVLSFTNDVLSSVHTVIQIERIKDLEYKTRVMRYFGGMLVNNTFHFKNLVVVIDGKKLIYRWSRDNVSTIVNKMCHQAESMI